MSHGTTYEYDLLLKCSIYLNIIEYCRIKIVLKISLKGGETSFNC